MLQSDFDRELSDRVVRSSLLFALCLLLSLAAPQSLRASAASGPVLVSSALNYTPAFPAEKPDKESNESRGCYCG